VVAPGVRVIAGTARGRRLVVPKGDTVRPTKDRVKAAMFSALTARDLLIDAVVLDLYAGSGALGVEALSRGAASVTFVDSAAAATQAITDNVTRCGFGDRSEIIRRDARTFLASARTTFDLAFVDPPYDLSDEALRPVVDRLAADLIPGGLVVLERGVRAEPVEPAGWRESWRRTFGDTLVVFLTSSS